MLPAVVVVISLTLSVASFAVFAYVIWAKASARPPSQPDAARDLADVQAWAEAVTKIADALGKLPAEIAALVASMIYLGIAALVTLYPA